MNPWMLFKNLLNLHLNEESDAILENHQTYLKYGLIRPYKHGDRVIFYSHQWLDYDHPDPEGKQLKILEEQEIDYLHWDIIDGRFAPDFTMGSSIINKFRDHPHTIT